MPIWNVKAEVTISIRGTVEAETEAEAIEQAEDLMMPDLCHSCTRQHQADDETWDVGELDGSAQKIAAKEGWTD